MKVTQEQAEKVSKFQPTLLNRASTLISQRVRQLPSWLRHEHLLAAILIVAALLIFYRDVVFGGHTFLMENTTAGTMPENGPFNYSGKLPEAGESITPPVIDPGAIAWEGEAYNRRAGQIVRNGEIPLWNKNAGMGEVLMADGATGSLEPLQFLF